MLLSDSDTLLLTFAPRIALYTDPALYFWDEKY